jgi:hypothetical protein
MASKKASAVQRRLDADFCNKIGTKRTSQPYRRMSAFGGKAEVGVGQLDFRV